MKYDKTKYFEIKECKKKTSELLADCEKLFPVYSWYLDERMDKDFPPPKKITTRYFKKTVEADENLKNKSADDLGKKGIEGITLRERIIMELQYFNETGEHLDIINITLCSGSRRSDGDVPDADWSGSKFEVGWFDAGDRGGGLRSREAVTLNPSSSNTSSLEKRVESLESDMEKIKKFLII